MKYFPAVLLATLIQASTSGAEMADSLTYDGDDAPMKGTLERPQPSETTVPSIVPDFSPSFKDSISVKRDGFSLIPGLVLLADYTIFDQDDVNLWQGGEQ